MKISQLINNSKIRIDKTNIDPSFLMGKDEFLEKLTEMGGTYSDLVSLCEQNVSRFGNELFWHYSLSDERYNGAYFVLVKEGVLRLPYEDVEIAENEHFNLFDARLCTEEFLRDAIEDLRCYTEYTVSVLKELSVYSKKRAGENSSGYMDIRLYQIPSDEKYHGIVFFDLEQITAKYNGKVPSEIYEAVFDGKVQAKSVDELYNLFNLNHPRDYAGRSMSVSDVVEIKHEGCTSEFYFCDSIGFKKIRFEPKEVRQNAI